MKKESFSLCIILRNTICATLVFLVMLSAPTGWLYDLWVGEGTEQGQWAQRGCPAAPAAGGYRSLLSEQYPGHRERRQSGSLSAGSSAGYWTSGRTYSQ